MCDCRKNKELRSFLKNIRNQIDVREISKHKHKFLRNKTFDNYLSLFNVLNNSINLIDFHRLKLKYNKSVVIFLADDNNNIFYFNRLLVLNDGTKVSENDKMTTNIISQNYNNYIVGFSNQYQLSEKQIKILTDINSKKSKNWKKYKNGNYLMASKYTPSTITVGSTDALTFETSNPTGSKINHINLCGNGYNLLLMTSSSGNEAGATLNVTYVPSNTLIYMIAVGGGGTASAPNSTDGASQGGGGAGYVLVNNNSFADYLNSCLSAGTDINMQLGGRGTVDYSTNTHYPGGDTIFGTYTTCYGGGAGGTGIDGYSNNGGTSIINGTPTGVNGGSGAITAYGENAQNSDIIYFNIPLVGVTYISGGGASSTTSNVTCTGGVGYGGYVSTDISPSQIPFVINGSYSPNSYGGGAGQYNNNYGVGGPSGIAIWYNT